MRFKLFVLLLLSTLTSFATHNRAGYISYTRIGTSGYKYLFRIYTYTNPTSVAADRCSETLLFTNIYNTSQVDSITCTRVNGTDPTIYPTYANCPNPLTGATKGWGQMLVSPYTTGTGVAYGGVKLNIYEGTKDFHNAGNYIFGMVDPNLDADVNNVGGGQGGSQNVAFALLDTLHLNLSVGLNVNNTPLVTNPPIDNACYKEQFCYNPGMLDPDNDSLVYSLSNFMTGDGKGNFYTAPNSSIPPDIRVDAVTGTLCWNSPWAGQQHGEYDIDMIIREYRRPPDGGPPYLVGSMVFAVQIYVNDCPPNTEVTITAPPAKGCVEAGSTYNSPVITATGNANNTISLDASGVAITGSNIGTNAFFSSISGLGSASGSLHWTPSCEAVHLNPYYVTVQASDNNTPVKNTNYSSIVVNVVSPAVQNLTAALHGDSIKVTWTPPLNCGTNQYNTINSYLVYRINSCGSFTPTLCHTGVPASSGYQYVGTVTTLTTTPLVYYDDNNGLGLPAGNSYSYLVVAKFDDGSLSMAPVSTQSACVTLHFGVPIITNVTVDTTDTQFGSITVKWQKPVIGAPNFDTLASNNNGPYHFELHKLDATGTYNTVIYTSPSKPYFAQLNNTTDVSFTDVNIDTKSQAYSYKVYFYSDSTHKTGSSAPASSIFASGVGHDKKVVLSWTAHTPWQDTLYYVYRQNYTNSGYTLVDSTHNTSDTIYNLTNNYSACFKIQSVGSYLNPNIVSPLYNFSQKVCATPVDDVPPCQPQLTIVGDCDAAVNKLVWRNPDHQCGINDVLKYYIYYTPRQDSTLTKIDSVLNVNDTTYTTNVNTQSIAGCYVIVAVDSTGNQSPLNNESCTDNCPEYELPNIFTPNGDNTNDLYVPVKNRYIRSVDFVLYNRWGEIVYEATNPSLGWDGKSKQMKQPVPDGVYFYTCTVYEIHYYGIKERKLKDFVQIIK